MHLAIKYDRIINKDFLRNCQRFLEENSHFEKVRALLAAALSKQSNQ